MMAGKKKKRKKKKRNTSLISHPIYIHIYNIYTYTYIYTHLYIYTYINTSHPVYNFNQQDYANFRHKLKLSETAWTSIPGCRVNQTDVSNTNNIFTPITPVNPEDKHPEQDFNETIENECI